MASREEKEKALGYVTEIHDIYVTQAKSFDEHAQQTKDFMEKKRLNGFASASRVQAERMQLVAKVLRESLPQKRGPRRAQAR
jgi:hypothetical protein